MRYFIFRVLRYIYHFIKCKYYTLLWKFTPKKDRLLFVYGGRAEGWPGIARSLYNEYPSFAQSIQNCNDILVANGGSEILSYFEDPVNEKYFDDESKFTCITAIQIATTKLYNDNGIIPNTVMGVSMGEPAAAYAAGALSAEEALKIAVSYMSIYKVEDMDYEFLFLAEGIEHAIKSCEQSPVWIEIIYEDNPAAVLITCHKKDIKELEVFLKGKNVFFKPLVDKTFIPYHTSLIKSHQKLLKDFHKDIEPRPLKCDYYSPTLGKRIPKNTILEVDYWYHLACVPVLFNSALQGVLNDGYKTFLQIGPPAISDRQFAIVSPHGKNKIFNVFQHNTSEVAHSQLILKKLQKIKFEPTLVSDDDLNTFNNFRKKFSVNSATSAHTYKYLRQHGPMHFLPLHNSWLLLNYDDIDQVLKQPDLYSSSLLKTYDPILLGADPEQHKVIRGLLHPLFSPAVIAELGQFTTITAERLLDELCKRDGFDIVKDYSDPVSLLALCNFFGLSADDANNMLNFTGKDYNNEFYWQRLEQYFKDNFAVAMLTKQDSLWGKLRELVNKNEFAFDDAISLMRIIWTAGMATTSALISAAVSNVLTRPALAAHITTDDKLVSKFVEECLRLHTSITLIHRITTQPVELAGQQLPANAVITLSLKSAMTDPAHYTDPEDFSISRAAKRNLAFGAGIHQCIGMGMARAEATSALHVLLKKLPELKAYDHSKPQYFPDAILAIMESLKLTK